MSSQGPKSAIEDLPADLLDHIFSFIPLSDLRRTKGVSRTFRATCNKDYLIKKRIRDDLPQATAVEIKNFCAQYPHYVPRILGDKSIYSRLSLRDILIAASFNLSLTKKLMADLEIRISINVHKVHFGTKHLEIAQDFFTHELRKASPDTDLLTALGTAHSVIGSEITQNIALLRKFNLAQLVALGIATQEDSPAKTMFLEQLRTMPPADLVPLAKKSIEIANLLFLDSSLREKLLLNWSDIGVAHLPIARKLLAEKALKDRIPLAGWAKMERAHLEIAELIQADEEILSRLTLDQRAELGHKHLSIAQVLYQDENTFKKLQTLGPRVLAQLGAEHVEIARRIFADANEVARLDGYALARIAGAHKEFATIIFATPDLLAKLKEYAIKMLDTPSLLVKLNADELGRIALMPEEFALNIFADPNLLAKIDNRQLGMIAAQHEKLAKKILTDGHLSSRLTGEGLLEIIKAHPTQFDAQILANHALRHKFMERAAPTTTTSLFKFAQQSIVNAETIITPEIAAEFGLGKGFIFSLQVTIQQAAKIAEYANEIWKALDDAENDKSTPLEASADDVSLPSSHTKRKSEKEPCSDSDDEQERRVKRCPLVR